MMEAEHCPKCGVKERTKAGFIQGVRRWLCKGCGCKYTRSTKRTGKPDEMKRLALQLYLEGMGFRGIGRVLDVSNVAVLKWVRAFGEEVERLRKPLGKQPKIAMIDEVWHFLASKKNSSGCGFRCVISQDGSSAFIWADAAPMTSDP